MHPGYFLCTFHRAAVSKILWFPQHRFSHPLYSFWVLTYYLSVHGLVTLVVCCHFCFFFLRYFDRILFLISADFQSYDDEIEVSKPRSYEKAPTMKSVIICISITFGFQLLIIKRNFLYVNIIPVVFEFLEFHNPHTLLLLRHNQNFESSWSHRIF